MLAMIFKSYENHEEDRKKPSDMEATVAHKKGAASIKPMNTTQMALR
jgi:hypothetical protein